MFLSVCCLSVTAYFSTTATSMGDLETCLILVSVAGMSVKLTQL